MKKIYIYLPLILFFIIGCEKEENVELQKESSKISTVTQEEALGIIDKISPGKGTNNGNLILLYDKIYFEPIINSQEKLTVIPVIFPKEGVISKILMLKINGKVNYVLFSMIPDNPLIDQKNFNGKILINNLDGKFINGFRVENGYIISKLILNAALNKCDSVEGFVGIEGDGCFQDLDEVIITTTEPYIPIDFIYYYSGGDSYSYDYQEGSSGGSWGGDTSTTENVFEDKIDDSNLDKCLKDILEILKNQRHAHGIGKAIEAFGGYDINLNLNWSVNSGSLSGATGSTSTTFNSITNTATTTFDSGAFTQGTDLSWARTILHESGHAFVVSIANLNTLTQEQKNRYLGKYYLSAYIDAGHPFIASTYVASIADILQEFGQSKGYTMNRNFYDDLAWGGLTDQPKLDSTGKEMFDEFDRKIYEETPWFFAAIPDSLDRKRIKDLISIELTGKDLNGNPISQKGANAGC